MTPTPYWNRNFQRHDPLTQRFARTLEEAFPESNDGIERPRPSDRQAYRIVNHPVLWMLAMLLFVLMLTAPRWWQLVVGA